MVLSLKHAVLNEGPKGVVRGCSFAKRRPPPRLGWREEDEEVNKEPKRPQSRYREKQCALCEEAILYKRLADEIMTSSRT
jgi:hypothetical protein